MDELQNDQDVSNEQIDTARILHHLLGSAFADRYLDYCHLADGTLPLRVSRPLAAHALREFESYLRATLRLHSETQLIATSSENSQFALAAVALSQLGFDDAATERAVKSLPARQNHRAEIIRIVVWLGLPPDGDVAKAWISLDKGAGKAHERSFHEPLRVDDQYRRSFQQPFQLVVREVVLALQRRYSSLMKRVEELASMPNIAQAVSLFKKEIPAALPLQWHFFQRLLTSDWLPHLERAMLLSQPDANAIAPFPFGAWPAGSYLLRMAASPDAETRRMVLTAVFDTGRFVRPDMRHVGIEVLAAVPPTEAAPFARTVASWLGSDARFTSMHVPERLLTRLAEETLAEAALIVARALLHVFADDGDIATLYPRNMYEYSLQKLVPVLARTCGLCALSLFIDLLRLASVANGKLIEEPLTDRSHFTFRPIADDEFSAHDVYSSLISAVRTCAELHIQEDPSCATAVVTLLVNASTNICKRIAMHILAINPAAQPELTRTWLTAVDLIEDSAYEDEYATLARAGFPMLSATTQNEVIDTIRVIPGRYRDAWRTRREQQGPPPNAEDEHMFDALVVKDAFWKWRDVLPLIVQAELTETVRRYGDPNTRQHGLAFDREESVLKAEDFSVYKIEEIVTFLKTWHPVDPSSGQTSSALAHQWRIAVQRDATRYAAVADQFANVPPIFLDQLIAGLDDAAKNSRDFTWLPVLDLVDNVFSRISTSSGVSSSDRSNVKDWLQVSQCASQLMKSGLRGGSESIGYEHATTVRRLVITLLEHAPGQPETDGFEASYTRDAFFAAQATLRGSAIELCILWLFWLSKYEVSLVAESPPNALRSCPEIAFAFATQLEDRSSSGRISRAVLGRYLGWLHHFGPEWTQDHLQQIFEDTDHSLRQAAWSAYLLHANFPVKELFSKLRTYYIEELTHLCTSTDDGREIIFRNKQFGTHLFVLYVTDTLQLNDELFERFFEVASSELRQHVMWYAGRYLHLPLEEHNFKNRSRALSYWEARLTVGSVSNAPDDYRDELETIGQWVDNAQIEPSWLLEQLHRMLESGFAPGVAFNVVGWLAQVCIQDINRSMRILAGLVDSPHAEPLSYQTQNSAMRKVLALALEDESAEIVDLANRTISILSTKGETAYLDLVR